MKLKIIPVIAIVLLTLSGCRKNEQNKVETSLLTHTETNSVYYWKTVLDLDSTDYDLIEDMDLVRIYLYADMQKIFCHLNKIMNVTIMRRSFGGKQKLI